MTLQVEAHPELKHLLYSSFSQFGGDRLLWNLHPNRLRILCYHGVCPDRLARESWMPSYFVSESAFEAQLGYLRRTASVLPLGEAAMRLRSNSLPPRPVCITFDDGYANNVQAAYPLLRKYEMPATIFVSSGYVDSADLFPFLKLKLIRLEIQKSGGDPGAYPLPEYKCNVLDTVKTAADRCWEQLRLSLTPDQRDSLRVMTAEELQSLDASLIEIGAHSHTHCILRNESRTRREQEIRVSIRRLSDWGGKAIRVFSYPNGEPGDFDDWDKEILRAEGVEAAVTGIGGANGPETDLLALKRYPVTLQHDNSRFRAEVCGFRNAMQSLAGRLN